MAELEKKTAAEEDIVIFTLHNETYGLPIANVSEIIAYQEPTHLAGSPPEVEGIINLRGKVIPVVDLRIRLGLPAQEPGRSTRIIIVSGVGETTGLVVDMVSEVQKISSLAIEPPPSVTQRGRTESFWLGVVKAGDRLIILLDPTHVLVEEALSL